MSSLDVTYISEQPTFVDTMLSLFGAVLTVSLVRNRGMAYIISVFLETAIWWRYLYVSR